MVSALCVRPTTGRGNERVAGKMRFESEKDSRACFSTAHTSPTLFLMPVPSSPMALAPHIHSGGSFPRVGRASGTSGGGEGRE